MQNITHRFFGRPGLSVRPGRRRLVAAGAHSLVVVGVPREPQPVRHVKVRLERAVHVVVQPAAHAVHGVPRTVALADQVIPQPIAGRGRGQGRRRRRRLGLGRTTERGMLRNRHQQRRDDRHGGP